MTYRSKEDSTDEGQPLTAVRFYSDYDEWNITPNDEVISFDGRNYESRPVEFTNFEQTNEINKNDIVISKVPLDVGIVELFRSVPPDYIVNVLINIFHRGETDSIVAWRGSVVNVNFKETHADITCESMITTIRKPILSRCYQVACAHTLYSEDCRLIKSNYQWTETGFTMDITATQLTHTRFGTLGTSYLTLGYVTFNNGETIQYRDIIGHASSTIGIDRPFEGLTVADAITVYPGCNKTMDTCRDKYDNLDNYGGYIFIPKKNPFINTMF